jgi:hypothetical protein
MKADLLDGIGDVRPGEGEVLESSCQTPVRSRVRNRSALLRRELALGVHWSGGGLTVSYPCPLQDVESILPLVKEEAIRTRLHSDSQEVVEHAQVLRGELLL